MPKKSPETLDEQRLKVIGNIFRRARENLRYSYRELSDLSGVSASQLLRMESGEFDFSIAKFMRVSEVLGLSVGIVLETAMFRSLPREALYSINSKRLAAFIEKGGISANEEAFDDRLVMLQSLVHALVEIAVSLILSSHPEALCFYFHHPFKPLQERVETFGVTRASFGISHQERAAAIKALLDDPVEKLSRWKLLDDDFLTAFLEWAIPNSQFSTVLDTRLAYASSLVGRNESNQLDSDIWDEDGEKGSLKLTDVSESANNLDVKTQLPSLLERLKKATQKRGKKTALAKYLGVPLASVSQWLSGDREPGGETTLRMLHWLELQKRESK